jgi:hypothetical protein
MIERFENWANKSDANKIKAWCLIMAIAVTLGVTIWSVTSSIEAAAFNRVTGSNVTTWDAMWLQLRVDRPTSN